ACSNGWKHLRPALTKPSAPLAPRKDPPNFSLRPDGPETLGNWCLGVPACQLHPVLVYHNPGSNFKKCLTLDAAISEIWVADVLQQMITFLCHFAPSLGKIDFTRKDRPTMYRRRG